MSDQQTHIIEDVNDWPISKFAAKRDEFVLELRRYTIEKVLAHKRYDLPELLQKSIFFEKKRIKGERWKVDPADEEKFWLKLEKELHDVNANSKATKADYMPVLERMIHRYAEEIVGNFKPKTFLFARKFLTWFFKRIYNSWSLRNPFKIWGTKESLLDKFVMYGPEKKIRHLFSKGVVVFVPTHFSNLDSILLGYKFDMKTQIPAFVYGAGLNLYNTEIIGYFISRLGTYRVDRRKKNLIYIETLKSMNTLSIIQGVNNLFFPGGTRSRSGKIEDKIKLGLLNSTVEAQRYIVDNNLDRRVFIVPLVTRFPFVLDANELISDYLSRQGQERYFHERPKLSPTKLLRMFLRGMYTNRGKSYLSYGQPMDVFGNLVDNEGNSIDGQGNIIDISTYFSGIEDKANYIQREAVYTKKLGAKIIEQYFKSNVIIASHLIAYLAYKHFSKAQNETDVFNLLLLNVKHVKIPLATIHSQINFIVKVLKEDHPEVLLSKVLDRSAEEIVEEGLKYLGVYNSLKALYIKKDLLKTESIKLLYYYHNQLSSSEIDAITSSKDYQLIQDFETIVA